METIASSWVYTILNFFAALLIVLLGLLVVWLVVIYILDVTQTQQAVRRNYPVIGRFRYMFEHMGEFFRQFFFAMDREELPFNRSERSWVYRAAKNIDRHPGLLVRHGICGPLAQYFLLTVPIPRVVRMLWLLVR